MPPECMERLGANEQHFLSRDGKITDSKGWKDKKTA